MSGSVWRASGNVSRTHGRWPGTSGSAVLLPAKAKNGRYLRVERQILQAV